MTLATLAAYAHFAGIMAMASVLFAQWMTLAEVGTREVRRLALLDLAYLAIVVVVLLSGVARLLWFAKGASFYLHNPVFWIKLALFAAIGLISIPPTRCFLRWRRDLRKQAYLPHREEAAYVRRFVVAELVLLVFVPLTAAMAARGIGMS